MIIKDTETLRKHLSVNGSFTHENVIPYLKKAERHFLKPHLGLAQLKVFHTPQTDDTIAEAQELAEEVVANYGFYLYLPIGAVQITDNGIHVVANENTKTATDKQFKELQRAFIRSAHEALDELLEHMEQFADKFADWFSSENYTVYKDLLVNKTSVFNKQFYIFNSRQTFVALRPNIKVIEDQFIVGAIGARLLSVLKTNQTITQRKKVKELLQQAIVAFTIMKTVDNGLFLLDEKGIHMRFDVLPYEKTLSHVNSKANGFLSRTKSNKRIEGEEYLKLAINLIEKKLDNFPEYSIKEDKKHINLTNTNSIVGL